MGTQGYIFYIDKMLLPVAPASVETKFKNMNSTVNLISEAEFNLLKQEGLQEISFRFMIPSQRYPFARYLTTYKKPAYYINKLKELKKKARPFQLIIIRNYPNSLGAYYNTNIKVSLEDWSIEENAEEGMDMHINVVFKEFVPLPSKKYDVSEDGTVTVQNQRWKDKLEQQICSTKAGQTLWQFVREETGGLEQMQTVIEVNGISSVTDKLSDFLRLW